MKNYLSRVTLLWLILAVPVSAMAASSLPPPIQALTAHGFDIESHFQAPSGMTGYVAQYRGRTVTVYLTADHKHVLIGTMIDARGENVGAKAMAQAKAAKYKDIWPKLAKAEFVVDGSPKAKRIVYEFTDANCPYCHKFWTDSRPWVKAGKVQVREIMVGILTPTSMAKGAAILGSDNRTAALIRNETHYSRSNGGGGIKPPKNLSDTAKGMVEANNQLMQSLGFSATPTIIYRDQNGDVQVRQGAPRGAGLVDVMGSSKP